MKVVFLIIAFFLLQTTFGQNFYLQIDGSDAVETKIIDSIAFEKTHKTVALLLEEQKRMETKLTNNGFFEWRLLKQEKINDSSFVFTYNIGKPIKNNTIYIGNLSEEEKKLLQIEKDTIQLSTTAVERFMKEKITLLEKKGYSLANLQLSKQKKIENNLYSELQLKISCGNYGQK